ncbi:MAG: TolB family protein [Clostridium sp.]|uniref:TolB family protein n=1 Tax=Clostridium sp. TaxID=1506 RepID=UPI003D6D9A61
MVSNEFYVEKLLCNDAAKIVIDEEFKCDLKNRIMLGDKYNNITELPKRKNSFKQSKYFKIASGFVICVFVSGTIFKVIDVPSKSIFGKGEEQVIIPISSEKSSTDDSSKKTSLLQPKDTVAIINNGSKLPVIAKGIDGSTVDKLLEKYSKKNSVAINRNQKVVNSEESDDDINEGLVKEGKSASLSVDGGGPVDIPKTGNKEEVVSNLKFYDSRYSLGEKSLVSVKDGGIYVKDMQSSIEKKLITYNEKTQIVEKPNFTPDDGIIYYASEKVTLANGDIGEKNGAIYLTDKNGQESSKLVDGKNPMISKDGKKLVYESEGKIFILDLATNDRRFVDNGKYPAFSDNGNTISYVKEDKETQNYDANTGKKDVYIKKTFSSLWVFDLSTENTHSLTNNEVNINGDSIQSWADAVRSGSVTSDLKVTSKYSYYESIWSSNNKEVYVIRKNNDAQMFEFIKFSLDK